MDKFRTKQVAKGLCIYCANKATNGNHCADHAAYKIESVRKLREAHRLAKLCLDCSAPANTGELLCEKHRLMHAARQQRYRERKGIK